MTPQQSQVRRLRRLQGHSSLAWHLPSTTGPMASGSDVIGPTGHTIHMRQTSLTVSESSPAPTLFPATAQPAQEGQCPHSRQECHESFWNKAGLGLTLQNIHLCPACHSSSCSHARDLTPGPWSTDCPMRTLPHDPGCPRRWQSPVYTSCAGCS